MRRRLVLLAASFIAASLGSTAATAEACTAKSPTGEVVEIPCRGQSELTAPGRQGKTYDPDELVTAISQVDGEICTILATITSPQGEEAITFDRFLTQIPTFGKPLHDIWAWIVDGLPGCPSLRPTPNQLAWAFVKQASPPASEPYVAPGHAITGRKAFLETRGPTTNTQTFDTQLGPLSITFEAHQYTVNWGDGSDIDEGPFPVPGAPFPDGKATHVFTHARTYDIVVRTEWTARWSVGGESGMLEGLSRTEQLTGFEARQLQAVRER